MKERVEEIFEFNDDVRAERIARTELTRATTFANQQIYKDAGITAKEWFTNPGACQWCIPLNGKIVLINDNFFDDGDVVIGLEGGELPLDYGATPSPPLHPNCRCDLLPVIP